MSITQVKPDVTVMLHEIQDYTSDEHRIALAYLIGKVPNAAAEALDFIDRHRAPVL